MSPSWRNLGLAAAALLVFGAACGGDAEERAERGLAMPDEQAVPGSEKEFEMTEEQREKQIDTEEAATEKARIEAVEE